VTSTGRVRPPSPPLFPPCWIPRCTLFLLPLRLDKIPHIEFNNFCFLPPWRYHQFSLLNTLPPPPLTPQGQTDHIQVCSPPAPVDGNFFVSRHPFKSPCPNTSTATPPPHTPPPQSRPPVCSCPPFSLSPFKVLMIIRETLWIMRDFEIKAPTSQRGLFLRIRQ